MAYMSTQAALARALNIAAGRIGSVLYACQTLAQLTSTVSCPAYSHIHQQYSYLFHQAPSSVYYVAAFLATDQSNLLGNYLEACFVQRRSVLASPLVVWLLSFAELN